jgi:hypothetical protein
MGEVRQRLLELLPYHQHRLEYRKRTEIAVEIVRQLEDEGQFPPVHYAFDNGVLTLELTRLIESRGQQWVSELEVSRHIQWAGRWRRVDELRPQHPESCRAVKGRCRNGEAKVFFAFTKGVRRYGHRRWVIVHEQADLSDAPRLLLTDALHWESGRVIQTWSYRWASEVFHEFGKQVCGLESAQVRKEEAVTRHFRLSCVAQSLVQRAPVSESTSERYAFAAGKKTTVRSAERSTGRQCAPCWNYASGILPRANPVMKCWRCCIGVLPMISVDASLISVGLSACKTTNLLTCHGCFTATPDDEKYFHGKSCYLLNSDESPH